LFCLLCAVVWAPVSSAYGKDPARSEPVEIDASSPSTPPVPDLRAIPPILDDDYLHRSRFQFELVPFGGTYLGRSLGSTFIAGGRLWFHIDKAWAVGARYGYTRIGSGTALRQAALTPDVHLVNAEASLSNPVALRLGRTLVQMDLYLTAGVGAIMLASQWDAYGLVGGGVRFYTGLSWLAVRIDVDSHIHRTRISGTSRIDVDMSLSLGVSFIFPPDPSPYER
jgi:outer membrane beta-barrel protein